MKRGLFLCGATLAIMAAMLLPEPLLAYGPEISSIVQHAVEITGAVSGPSASTEIAGGEWAIQIGAYAQAATAQEQLALVAARETDLLGGAAAAIVPVDLSGGRRLFRARFGSFTRQEAEDLCTQLRERDEACVSAEQSAAAESAVTDTMPPAPAVQVALAGPKPLDDAALAEMRGGFFMAGGAQFDFGASVRTLVNGQLALESNVQWTAGGAVTQQVTGSGTVPIPSAQLAGLFGGSANPGMDGVTIPSPSGSTAVLTNLASGQVQNVLLNSASNQTVVQNTNVQLTVYNLPQLQQQARQQLLSMRLANDVIAAGLAAAH
jgi:hypothetical protein